MFKFYDSWVFAAARRGVCEARLISLFIKPGLLHKARTVVEFGNLERIHLLWDAQLYNLTRQVIFIVRLAYILEHDEIEICINAKHLE